MSRTSLVDLTLKKEVEIYFKEHKSDIKIINDIITEKLKLNEKFSFPNIDEIYQNLNFCKRFAQLILNLYNEFEIYKNLPILLDNKFNEYYSSNLSASFQPDESKVVEVLYQYVLWFLVAKYKEIRNDYQKLIGDKTELVCGFCEFPVNICELKCSVCGTDVSEILEKQSRVNNGNKKELDKIENQFNTNENQVSIDNNISCGNSTEKNDGEFSESKCINFDNDNEKLFDRMKDYDNMCQDPKNSVDINEMWNCWWDGCKKRNYGNNKYCKFCGIDKTANQNRGELIDIFKDEMADKIWICNKCQFFNKRYNSRCLTCEGFRYTSDDYVIIEKKELETLNTYSAGNNKWKCDKCEFMNQFDFLSCSACSQTKTKPCKICSEPIPAIKEFCSNCNPEWYCWYRLCGNINYGNWKYCKDCGIDRNAIDMYGFPIDRFINNKLDKIWICTQCFVVNDIDSLCKTRYCSGRKCKICLHCKSVYRWYDDYCYKCYKCL